MSSENYRIFVGYHDHMIGVLFGEILNKKEPILVKVPSESYAFHMKQEFDRWNNPVEFEVVKLTPDMPKKDARVLISSEMEDFKKYGNDSVLVWHWGFGKYVDYHKLLSHGDRFSSVVVICDITADQFDRRLVLDMKNALDATVSVFKGRMAEQIVTDTERKVVYCRGRDSEPDLKRLTNWTEKFFHADATLRLTDLDEQDMYPLGPQFVFYLQDLQHYFFSIGKMKTSILLNMLVSIVQNLKNGDFFPESLSNSMLKAEARRILCSQHLERQLQDELLKEFDEIYVNPTDEDKSNTFSNLIYDEIMTTGNARVRGICFQDGVDILEVEKALRSKAPHLKWIKLEDYTFPSISEPVLILGTASGFTKVNGTPFDSLLHFETNIFSLKYCRDDNLIDIAHHHVYFIKESNFPILESQRLNELDTLYEEVKSQKLLSRKRNRVQELYRRTDGVSFPSNEPPIKRKKHLPPPVTVKTNTKTDLSSSTAIDGDSVRVSAYPEDPKSNIVPLSAYSQSTVVVPEAEEAEKKSLHPVTYSPHHMESISAQLSSHVIVFCFTFCQANFKAAPRTSSREVNFDQYSNVHTFVVEMDLSVASQSVKSYGVATSKKLARTYASLNMLKELNRLKLITDPRLSEKIYLSEETP